MEKKKPSLFAQRMGIIKSSKPDSGPIVQGIREKDESQLQRIEKEVCSINYNVDIPKISIEKTKLISVPNNDKQIHEENMKKILSMDSSEIEQNLKEIQGSLNPSTIEFLRRRGQAALKKPNQVLPVKDLQEAEITCLQSSSNKTCMHLNICTSEFDRVRFDCEGKPVQFFSNGAWVGECQGYTLREIINLLRSSIPSQRILAVDTLIILLKENTWQKINFLTEECELGRVIVFSITDKNINIRSRVLALLSQVFEESNQNLKIQRFEDFLFPSTSSKANSLLPKEVKEKPSVWEEEECRISSQSFNITTADSSKDFIASLLYNGLLDTLLPIQVSEILSILVSISLHSVTSCYFLIRHSIFNKILEATPHTYTLLSILALSSLPCAHKISQNLPQRFFSDLLTIDSSLSLLFSLFAHKQIFDIRAISFQKCQEGSSQMFSAISRLIQSFTTDEYKGIAELGYYKFLSQVEVYGKNYELIESVGKLIECFLQKKISTGLDLAQVSKSVFEILTSINEELGDLEFKIGNGGLNENFNPDHLEAKPVKVLKLIKTLLTLAYELKTFWGIEVESAKANIMKYYMWAIQNLNKILPGLGKEVGVKKIICYRLREIIQFLIVSYQFLEINEKADLVTISFFLSVFDEIYFMSIIEKIFGEVPEFFKGFLYSEKNLLMSYNFHEKNTKVASYFPGLDENPYFPLPFDWIFSVLPSSPPEVTMKILKFVNSANLLFNYPLSGVISDINMLFVRKDQDYQSFNEDLGPLIKGLVSSKLFAAGVNQCKNSVLNTTKDYIANSYLEPIYSIWIVSFLQDEVDADIFKDVYDEIDPLFSRVIHVVQDYVNENQNKFRKLGKLLQL